MARTNLRTSLRQRQSTRPMDRFDRLPPELRSWLAQAALPWSPRSSLKLWNKCVKKSHGNSAEAVERLRRAEAKLLARDCGLIWGPGYPAIWDAPRSES